MIARKPFSQLSSKMSRNSASISLRWLSGRASHAANNSSGWRLLHRREVQIAEKPPRLEVAGEQGIRHLPEEVLGRVMPGHGFPCRKWRGRGGIILYITVYPQYNRCIEAPMATGKTSTLTFRIEPA